MLDRAANSGPPEVTREWAIRSEFWQQFSSSQQPRRPKRERRNHPLILSGYGVSLRIENGALEIRNGFTHYPQQREEFRFFRGQLDVPERIIMLDGDGSLSFSVIEWLQEQNIVLVRIGWDGKSTVVIGGSGSPTNGEKLKWQFDLEHSPHGRIEFGTELISKKLEASRNTLLANFPNSEIREKAISQIAKCRDRLRAGRLQTIDGLLQIEGAGANAYFSVWLGLAIRWKKGSEKRVPENWLAYDRRSSILSGKKFKNWRASHPINAMLNYGYAVLEANTRIRVVSEGYDPRIGILHVGRTREKEDSFVFDMMEPLRPVVDGAVLDFVRDQTFSAKDFVLRSDGACRLNPQLAGAVSLQVEKCLSGSVESSSPTRGRKTTATGDAARHPRAIPASTLERSWAF